MNVRDELTAKGEDMATIQVSDTVYQKLTNQANIQRISIEELLEPVFNEFVAEAEQQPKEQTLEQWQQWFDAWQARARAQSLQYPPGFRADVSRESIYEGR